MILYPNIHSRRRGRPGRAGHRAAWGPRCCSPAARAPHTQTALPRSGAALRGHFPFSAQPTAESLSEARAPGEGPNEPRGSGTTRPGRGASPHRGPPARRGRNLREPDKSDETEPPRLTRRAAPQPLRHAPQLPVQPAEDLVQPLQVLRGRGAADRHGERPPPADSGLRAASRPRFRHRPRGPAPAQRGGPAVPDRGRRTGRHRAAAAERGRRGARCPLGAVVAGLHAAVGRHRLRAPRPAPLRPTRSHHPLSPGGAGRGGLLRARSVRTRRAWSRRRGCWAAGARCWAPPCPCPSCCWRQRPTSGAGRWGGVPGGSVPTRLGRFARLFSGGRRNTKGFLLALLRRRCVSSGSRLAPLPRKGPAAAAARGGRAPVARFRPTAPRGAHWPRRREPRWQPMGAAAPPARAERGVAAGPARACRGARALGEVGAALESRRSLAGGTWPEGGAGPRPGWTERWRWSRAPTPASEKRPPGSSPGEASRRHAASGCGSPLCVQGRVTAWLCTVGAPQRLLIPSAHLAAVRRDGANWNWWDLAPRMACGAWWPRSYWAWGRASL